MSPGYLTIRRAFCAIAVQYAQKNICPPVLSMNQVKEIIINSPDNTSVPEETASPAQTQPASDPYAGTREWIAQWRGPFFSEKIPPESAAGIYLIYVGNYPIFVSSSANIVTALTRHIVFSGRQIIPIDNVGREILGYSKTYHQPLNIKTALLYEGENLISPKDAIHCYRRAAAAIAFCHRIPCNKASSSSYEFEPLTLISQGKYFPLKARFEARQLIL